jgi:tRNA (cmo5U34)-methyltransferase
MALGVKAPAFFVYLRIVQIAPNERFKRQNMHTTDTLYSDPLTQVKTFRFDEAVVKVFPDMINRSVPGYATIIDIIGNLAERYATANSNCYDLGCSLGAVSLAMRHRIHAPHCRIIGIDNSEAMLARCQQVIDADSGKLEVELHCADLCDVKIHNASVVVLNFTLQFIALEKRADIVSAIYQGLNPGGVLIISEKLAFDDKQHHALMNELHHNFKRANGYSDLEIAQKRTAIENILIPETLSAHRNRLNEAGFNSVELWFQCFNFASMIAIK